MKARCFDRYDINPGLKQIPSRVPRDVKGHGPTCGRAPTNVTGCPLFFAGLDRAMGAKTPSTAPLPVCLARADRRKTPSPTRFQTALEIWEAPAIEKMD
jgi:hypothetical protein